MTHAFTTPVLTITFTVLAAIGCAMPSVDETDKSPLDDPATAMRRCNWLFSAAADTVGTADSPYAAAAKDMVDDEHSPILAELFLALDESMACLYAANHAANDATRQRMGSERFEAALGELADGLTDGCRTVTGPPITEDPIIPASGHLKSAINYIACVQKMSYVAQKLLLTVDASTETPSPEYVWVGSSYQGIDSFCDALAESHNGAEATRERCLLELNSGLEDVRSTIQGEGSPLSQETHDRIYHIAWTANTTSNELEDWGF
jgi:hypothetical protein